MYADPIRSALDAGKTVSNAWILLGTGLGLELVASTGWDTVTIDLQHGYGGFSEMAAMITAANAANISAIVRVPHNEPGYIHRALDVGAQGVVAPMVNTREEAERFVSACKYPPIGERSFGPLRASLVTDSDYPSYANDWTFCAVQIETQQALDNIDEILSVEGLDAVLVGPSDLTLSVTKGETLNTQTPVVLDALDLIVKKAKEHNVYSWGFAGDNEFARIVVDKGFQMVTAGLESNFIIQGSAATLKEVFGR